MFKTIKLIGLTLLFLLVACGAPAQEQAAAPTATQAVVEVAPTDVPTLVAPTLAPTDPPPATDTPLPEPTDTAVSPTAVPEVTEPVEAAEPVVEPSGELVYGLTEEGAYFVGYEDAEITMIDYSDFM